MLVLAETLFEIFLLNNCNMENKIQVFQRDILGKQEPGVV